MRECRRTVVGTLLVGAAGAAVLVYRAEAQTQLPEIVVTTPSPVAKPARKAVTKKVRSPVKADAPPAPTATAKIPADTFATVTVVPAGEIVSVPSATLAGALLSQPGIIASTFAPGASR